MTFVLHNLRTGIPQRGPPGARGVIDPGRGRNPGTFIRTRQLESVPARQRLQCLQPSLTSAAIRAPVRPDTSTN